MAKKDIKDSIEIIESPEALAKEVSNIENLFKKNSKMIYGLVGIIILGAAAYFGNKYYQNSQAEEGEKELFKAVYSFEADSLTKANQELLSVSDNYGGSAQNLADFYLGASYLKQGRFNEAIEKLKNFSSGDLLVQARAYSLIGDAYMENKAYSEAISYYQKAAEYRENKFFTPGYLVKLAVAYEANNNIEGAMDAYTKIIEDYPNSAEIGLAKKYKSMLEGSIQE